MNDLHQQFIFYIYPFFCNISLADQSYDVTCFNSRNFTETNLTSYQPLKRGLLQIGLICFDSNKFSFQNFRALLLNITVRGKKISITTNSLF